MTKKIRGTFCDLCGADRKESTPKKQEAMVKDHSKGGFFFGWGYQCQTCTEANKKKVA